MRRICHLCLLGWLLLAGGCRWLPQVAYQPVIHNPFPQLSRVAVAPFFNLSTEPTVDGRQFAAAYYAELQAVPGFEVVPIGVVENVMLEQKLSLDSPQDAQQLARALGVDAVVVGAVTDFSPYYPPRCGLQIEWYAANPCFHPIPPGYGLPWGTPQEEQIPAPLVFEAEMALARAQLKTQTPKYEVLTVHPGSSADAPGEDEQRRSPDDRTGGHGEPGLFDVEPTDLQVPVDEALTAAEPTWNDLPPDWPDPRGFIPPGPSCVAPTCEPSFEPVLRHTKIYHGHDGELTEALASYYDFRDDARSGRWQSYLQRSDDFIRFCCHTHIAELLSARGGAGQTRVVWRWPVDR